MRELDRILEGFLENGFAALTSDEKGAFAAILDYPDPDLHAYLLGKAEPADPELANILHRIRATLPV